MTDKEYRKIIADARRSVSRKYGFRQSSYINFKVDGGYFFCLYFLTGEVRLTVKPMYADDLWWDIWGATENKKEPLSLRGIGAYSLSGQKLFSYEIKNTTEKSKLENQFEQLFKGATAEITKFIADNPDADTFYPDESKMDHDPDRLLYLMALIHNGKEEIHWKLLKALVKISIDVSFKAECLAIAIHISDVGATVKIQYVIKLPQSLRNYLKTFETEQ